MFLILDVTSRTAWPSIIHNKPIPPESGNPVRIPDFRRPTVLQQGTIEQARAEVERLLREFPSRKFALFSCSAMAELQELPWAVTQGGDVVQTVKAPLWTEPSQ
ncbi:MAG: hypothetical protein LCH79_16405 [Proteobacteria bacterium]|nr:hypothetical protein [Pseudomonadota bacterium]